MIIINDVVDQYLEKSNENWRKRMTREQNRFWPTECSCNIERKVYGKCAREVYYSMKDTNMTNPISARGLRICDAGNMYEDKEIERVKNIEYYKNSAEKFNFKIPGTEITIAGKLDIVYNIDGKVIGGEIKSGYGYSFKQQVFDAATTIGLPVLKHLMQVMMYLYNFKYINKEAGIDEFYITYIDRGDCENTQFGIKLTEDDYPIIENEKGVVYVVRDVRLNNPRLFNQNPKGKREQNKIDKKYKKLKSCEVNIANIFNRFITIADYIKQDKLPPKDYKYMYTQDEITEKYKNGEISKLKYDKIMKNGLLERDFQCMYCNYLKNCIQDDKLIKFNI